ncbi:MULTISPECIES: maleylpyruvate isomerase family mycothiol-dependent enzyme [Streptomyces]|uniref:Maleylpyruvate isomerase family mycothiol-dependent enzyme n=1 Tax=Streptomyces caniscabiei TaxID=2746961 RepID=A0ABU4MXM0_9ACTN|nr:MULTISPECIES: maleylpyruvate isomerase family mycothiol-dependent enzyme [Streptomyces]MBE4741100.1 maleylpyruvate isomerase family mycothiol-dependent enzyme [Streptomyces caniscabiei]MBE4760449.1 maleylpyruvate isomerase family mycothiol-dependent enzyme [Streptomyces caniscabiei]MBE4774385.1 maleylpyruvate isomerase family mycothiol-dependent enzyme [Streptomyces caniscabiei]MBE4789392.1 maleylpyruvate isomerase family mycothiol-dependent enzyme [Streptomyces caniscabiei]MBE4798491.1 mal
METAEHIRALDEEGRLLATAARKAGTDAEVPTCPSWRVRDLVRHTGAVHRWATAFVAEGHPVPRPLPDGPGELDGDALLTWFEDGHRRLLDTLRAAPADLDCWTFLPAPSPRAFWARRQAHETAVHRADAESALGAASGFPVPDFSTSLAVDFAVDGIDELLLGFHARPRSRVRTGTPRVLRVRATDTDAVWTVRLSSEPPAAERTDPAQAPDAECEITGPASRLYLALWNRIPFPAVTGDPELAELWRESSGI